MDASVYYVGYFTSPPKRFQSAQVPILIPSDFAHRSVVPASGFWSNQKGLLKTIDSWAQPRLCYIFSIVLISKIHIWIRITFLLKLDHFVRLAKISILMTKSIDCLHIITCCSAWKKENKVHLSLMFSNCRILIATNKITHHFEVSRCECAYAQAVDCILWENKNSTTKTPAATTTTATPKPVSVYPNKNGRNGKATEEASSLIATISTNRHL